MINQEYKMDFLKKHFVKEKSSNPSASLLFLSVSLRQCLAQAAHMAALKLLTGKRELMLFFPFTFFQI